MKKEITREQRIEMARTQTEKVATMKDWRITNKYNRIRREAARRMMEKGGFAEMTQAEAHAIEADIPEYVDEVRYDAGGNAYVEKERADKEVRIWGYMWNRVWKTIQLTAF